MDGAAVIPKLLRHPLGKGPRAHQDRPGRRSTGRAEKDLHGLVGVVARALPDTHRLHAGKDGWGGQDPIPALSSAHQTLGEAGRASIALWAQALPHVQDRLLLKERGQCGDSASLGVEVPYHEDILHASRSPLQLHRLHDGLGDGSLAPVPVGIRGKVEAKYHDGAAVLGPDDEARSTPSALGLVELRGGRFAKMKQPRTVSKGPPPPTGRSTAVCTGPSCKVAPRWPASPWKAWAFCEFAVCSCRKVKSAGAWKSSSKAVAIELMLAVSSTSAPSGILSGHSHRFSSSRHGTCASAVTKSPRCF